MAVRERPATGSLGRQSKAKYTQVAAWLFICAALVFAMVVLGGVTRLTGSGLSMVDWDPLMGVVPPLSEADWRETFERYKQYPEYQQKNRHMTVDGFKVIFAFEYAHRMLGRLIGLVFILPLLYFAVRRKLPPGSGPRLTVLLLLGAGQGLMGWFMVKSGLVDVPYVSHYRLTAHLLLAVLIYAMLLWTAFSIIQPQPRMQLRSATPRRTGLVLLAAVAVTLGSGGLVAGLKAGFAYNTFPLMAGAWVPDGLFRLEPWWRNFFDNITLVQFDHRLLGMTVAMLGVLLWALTRRHAKGSPLMVRAHWVLGTVALQVTLGISTLVLFVPVPLAAAHQGGGLLVLTAVLWYLHALRRG